MSSTTLDINEYLGLLARLVNIDSGSREPESTGQVAGELVALFRATGAQVSEHQLSEEFGPCLKITNNNEGPYDILLLGHMDTVFAAGTAARRPLRIEGDRAYGPGVIDMKSGLLSMYYLLGDLMREDFTGKICVALNSDEEVGSRASRAWLEDIARRSSYVLVMEPARQDGALVSERKGLGRFDIEFSGREAHAGVEPEKGASAIGEMAWWIVNLHMLTDYRRGTTLNVGVASGGTASNVVAGTAKIQVDLRLSELADLKRVEDHIGKMLANPHIPGVTVKVSGGISPTLGRPPMKATDETRRLCRVVEAVGREIGVDVRWTATGGGSDGNFSAALGIPTIDGMGPVGGGAHSDGEYLEIPSVLPRFLLLKGTVARLAQSSR